MTQDALFETFYSLKKTSMMKLAVCLATFTHKLRKCKGKSNLFVRFVSVIEELLIKMNILDFLNTCYFYSVLLIVCIKKMLALEVI